MSENKIQNEQELWDVLDGKAAPEVKPEPKPAKPEPKFAKPGAPKGKVDSFFLTCMAGVAAVSERLVKAIGIRQMARLDFLLTDEGKIFFNEINTFPGMTSSSLYPLLTREMGLAEGEFINRLIAENLP